MSSHSLQGCVYTLTGRENHDDYLGDNDLPVVKIKLTINGDSATITRQLTPPVPSFDNRNAVAV
jgi:hypothetical protein